MRIVTIILLALALGTGCKSRPTEKPRTGTLYERVGKQAGLQAIVDDFAKALGADGNFGPRVAKIDMAAFRAGLGNQLCREVGGECPDQSQGMDAIYQTLALSEEEFLLFVELFVASANSQGLPQAEQNDLIDTFMRLQDRAVKAAPPASEGAAAPAAPAGEGAAAPAAPAGGAAAAP